MTTKLTAVGLKKHKPCKRCEGMPAGRDGYCVECRRELANIGKVADLRTDRDMCVAVNDLDGALRCAIAIDKAKGYY